MHKTFLKNDNNGYALLFSIIIISVISVITIGLANLSFKQLLLSSSAKYSQVAFYQADMASECALYVDMLDLLVSGSSFSCGVDSTGNPLSLSIIQDSEGYYIIEDTSLYDSNQPCFSIKIGPDEENPLLKKIVAKGYSSCKLSDPRTVEREINISY
jgi:hypothetical protein